jgi:menaquinone-9 beta-reductase
VTMFDASHPREKPCGGGVTGRALSLVAGEVDGALPAVTITAARFVDSSTSGGASVHLAHNDAKNALVVSSRRAFDGLLVAAAERAGAQLIAERVSGIERDGPEWRVRTANGGLHTAHMLLGADGANSFVRRRVARPFPRAQLSIATGFFAHGTTSDEILIGLSASPPGYIWSFPRPDHLAIGICAQADAGVGAEALRARAADWIRTTAVAGCAQLESYSWPIPSLTAADLETLDVAGPGWLLAGDAAGLVDPITREGIYFALQSAAFAAEALAAGHSVEHSYASRVRAEIVDELARAARFKSRFFQPRFIELLMDALKASEPIRQVMADLISGTQSYRGLKRRLAGTFEFRLAVRAIFGS